MNYKKLNQVVVSILITLLFVGCGAPKPDGVGVPVTNNLIEVIVNRVHIEDELIIKNGVRKAPESTTMIVVDTRIRILDNVPEATVDLGEVGIRGTNNDVLYALKGFGSSDPGEPFYLASSFAGFAITLNTGDDLALSLVFVVNNDAVDQTFILEFPDINSILLTIR